MSNPPETPQVASGLTSNLPPDIAATTDPVHILTEVEDKIDTPVTAPIVQNAEPPASTEAVQESPAVAETPAPELGVADESVNQPETKIKPRREQNVYIDGPLTGPAKNPDLTLIAVPLPTETDDRLTQILSQAPEIKLGDNLQSRIWDTVARAALGMGTAQDAFTSTLENPDAVFFQYTEHNGEKLRSGEAKFGEKQNTRFNGEAAMIRAAAHLGLGTAYTVALWNTGLWVTFKPPSEQSLLELYRQLTSDQILLGRLSYGLIYSNTSAFVIDRMCNFAREHILRISANKEEINKDNILDHVKAQDISSFLWGLACTMFPKGFDYSRACMADPTKCQHSIKESINIRKLQMVDRNSLTDYQKAHMADHRSQMKLTINDLKRYEAEMTKASSRTFRVNEKEASEFEFTLRTPSISEYIASGHRWIDDIVSTVEKALGASVTADEKNRVIELNSRATVLRQYSHWIARMGFDTNTIDDQQSVEEVINMVSTDQVIRETVLNQVKKFIENSSVAVIAIPTYDCPACGVAQEGPTTYPHRTSLIPIDVTQLFFVLVTQKYQELLER